MMKGWVKKQGLGIKATLQRFRCISLISAISFKGDHNYAFVLGNNNKYTFITFLEQLVDLYDKNDKEWREKKIIMMDNATVHQSKEVKSYIIRQRIPVLFTGVASFISVPVEMLFSRIKRKF